METAEATQEPGTDVIAEVKGFTAIASADQYSRVATLRGLIKDMGAKIKAYHQPAIDSAKTHLDLLKKELSDKIDPLDTEYKRLGGLLVTFDQEQQRIKRQKELEIEAAQRKAAQEEKERLAKLAAEMGDKKLAKEIQKAPVEVAPVVVTADVPSSKDTGVTFREDWVNFECTDLKKVPLEYHLLNEVAVRKVVRALKGATNIPGIKVLPPNKIPVQR